MKEILFRKNLVFKITALLIGTGGLSLYKGPGKNIIYIADSGSAQYIHIQDAIKINLYFAL
jgi:hypothetical protein